MHSELWLYLEIGVYRISSIFYEYGVLSHAFKVKWFIDIVILINAIGTQMKP